MSALMGLRITAIDRDRIKAATMAESTENLVQEQRKLVSMLSHEFRTPLAVIQRAAEMVTLRLHKEAAANGTYDVPRPVTDRLKRIQDQSGKLARLVDVFLGKDNLNAPQFALARKLIPAKGFLGEFTAMAQRENAQIGLRIAARPTAFFMPMKPC
jgi:signal transduction histidine kinase